MAAVKCRTDTNMVAEDGLGAGSSRELSGYFSTVPPSPLPEDRRTSSGVVDFLKDDTRFDAAIVAEDYAPVIIAAGFTSLMAFDLTVDDLLALKVPGSPGTMPLGHAKAIAKQSRLLQAEF